MGLEDKHSLAESLNATLHKVEQESGLSQDNPDMIELKRIVSRKIADLDTPETLENPTKP
ncbi:MAG TPA: hypothetical protein VFB43_06160 [Terracidiphilus sp.]|jgi:hypothetical protein|nr:hypothetical protein [Terracidiphilus sp.]